MSLLFGGDERRSVSYQDVFGTGGSVDLLGNGAEGALRLVPLYACVRLVADQFASAPLHGYEESPDGVKRRLVKQPQLLTAPGGYGTMFDWKYRGITSLLLRGDAVGLVTAVDRAGWATGCEWLPPNQVAIDESGSGPRFFFRGREIPRSSVVHIPAFTLAGKASGLSPLGLFIATLETGQAAQLRARDWFSGGAVPSGVLKNTDKVVDAGKASEIKDRFKAAIAGGDLFVTGKDWEYDTIGVPANEARFIEQLKMTATQLASVYGVPPEMVGGETGASLTYSTVEMNQLNLLMYAVRPWVIRFEEALTAMLPGSQYAKFNLDAGVRADLKTRMEAHEIAGRIGLETNSEGRALEDRPPLTDGERAEWLHVWKQPNTPEPSSTRSTP